MSKVVQFNENQRVYSSRDGERYRVPIGDKYVVKYIARAGRKTADSLQDLRKAAWYLDREIKRINSKAPYMVK